MRITHPRLANALHESTNIQTVLEKNDEDLIEYSFKSLRIEGIKKSNLSVQSCVFSNCSTSFLMSPILLTFSAVLCFLQLQLRNMLYTEIPI